MNSRKRDELRWMAITIATAALLFVACGGNSSPVAAPATTKAPATTAAATTTIQNEDFVATSATFVNIHKWTHVRFFYVTNALGHLDATLKVARSTVGGTYPVGTIIQLVPQEAMIKRKKGFNPAGNDWEFFFLDVTAQGAKIATRGANEVKNRFGGNCSACHMLAKPNWDFICEQTHGCAALPIGRDVIKVIQDADPRPM